MTPEGKIKSQITKYLKEKGILNRRYNAASSAFGYPDIDVWHAGHYIGLEVKTPDGHATDVQMKMQLAIQATGNYCEFVTSVEDVKNVLERASNEDKTTKISRGITDGSENYTLNWLVYEHRDWEDNYFPDSLVYTGSDPILVDCVSEVNSEPVVLDDSLRAK